MTNRDILNMMDENEVAENSVKEIIKLLTEISAEEITFRTQMCEFGCGMYINLIREKHPEIAEKYEKEIDNAWTLFYTYFIYSIFTNFLWRYTYYCL